jgi:hypothetical protein
MGIGYSCFEVAQLRLLKSTHIHIFHVFFFSTGTMLETESTYWQDCMNLACSSRSTTSFALPMISGLKF